jgi:quinoprotein relay system zinc metallohydrolase 2
MGRIAALVAGIVAAALPAVAAEPFPVTEVAPGVFVRHGVDEDATKANDDAIANLVFVVGERAVAVIDPGGSRGDGERLRATVAAHGKLPVAYVIMTHGHPDHVFGGAAFRADKPVYVGNAKLPGALAARGTFYRHRLEDELGREEAGNFVAPSMLVDDRAEIDLGGRVLELTAWPAAHSAADLSVMDRKTRTLLAGDLLFVGRIPSLDGSLAGWLEAMEALTHVAAARAVPGHGPVSVAWPGGAAPEIRYLRTLRDETRAMLRSGGDIERAMATVAAGERGKWALFDDYNGRNAAEAFRELEWE